MATQKGKNTSKNQPQGAKLSFNWKISTTEREFSHAKSNHFNGNPHDHFVKLNYFHTKFAVLTNRKLFGLKVSNASYIVMLLMISLFLHCKICRNFPKVTANRLESKQPCNQHHTNSLSTTLASLQGLKQFQMHKIKCSDNISQDLINNKSVAWPRGPSQGSSVEG